MRSALPALLVVLTACKGGGGNDDTGCLDDDRDGVCANEDCDDSDATISPDEPEDWYDGIDQNCDGRDDDQDEDGYVLAEDCDDLNSAINPGASETWYDGTDQDCDGRDDDQDEDGYGIDQDCNDTDANLNPAAEEIWYDGVDQNCDGNDQDQDQDGSPLDEDCDDLNASSFPDATEVWYDGIDQDCDGNDDDQDEDGSDYRFDCDDTDPNAFPGNLEVWYDGVDNDCEGDSDFDADSDGFEPTDYDGTDCDDSDPTINPDAHEVLSDSTDQDCDGGVDTSAWLSLPAGSSTDLQGPRITETVDGVLISVLSEDHGGSGRGGAFWSYLDPVEPWSGATATSGWNWTTATWHHGQGYDIAADDGDNVVEAFTLEVSTTTYIIAAVTDSSGTFGTTSISGTGLPDFEDVQITYDGSDFGLAACATEDDWVVYLRGDGFDLWDGDGDYAYDNETFGGSTCAANPSNDKVIVSDGSNWQKYSWTSGTSMGTGDSGTDDYVDIDWSFDGTNMAFAAGLGTGRLELGRNASTTTVPTSGTPTAVQVAIDDRDVYAAYVDSSGDAWLVYGRMTTSFTEVALERPDSADDIDDVDIWLSSKGPLIVAVRQGDDLFFTAYER